MELSSIKWYLLSLPVEERLSFLSDIEQCSNQDNIFCRESRRELLNNKQGFCPHCGDLKYVKFGFKSNSQRYKCKGCGKSFTEYTGTWMLGIYKKDKIDTYMVLMLEEKSLDKIKSELLINKKTAFDWRHKILAYLSDVDKDDFTGVKESIKNHKNKIQELVKKSIVDTNAYNKYRKIDENYQLLISTQF